MNSIIIKYQKAFNNMIDKLKKNEYVLATMVFGSMVSGDIWKESDIDLYVIVEDDLDINTKNIHTDEEDVSIHMKIIKKAELKNICDNEIKGGKFHRIFVSSKLVFSKDLSITSLYNRYRCNTDFDKESWNLVYLSKLLKEIELCKKYYENNGKYNSYNSACKIIEEFSKLYINFNGYMISKDVINMAVNLDDSFRILVDKLFFGKRSMKNSIEEVLLYIENFLNDNIQYICSKLLRFLKEKDELLTAEQIQKDNLFLNYDIDMECIVKYLLKKGMLNRQERNVKCKKCILDFKENVYFI